MRPAAAIALLGLFGPGPAVAQDGQEAKPAATAGATHAVAPIRAEDLPISVARIQRKLAQLPASTAEANHGLRLNYYIEVVGKAPPIDILKNFNVKSGPVPFSAPTHRDFLNFVTPQEFRAPPFDLSALIAWLAQRHGKSPR